MAAAATPGRSTAPPTGARLRTRGSHLTRADVARPGDDRERRAANAHVNKDRLRLLLACLATLAIVVPLAYLWQHSRLPSTYSVMSMGYDDYGGGSARHDGAARHRSVSVKDLVDDPNRKPDKVVDLVARKGEVKLADGQKVDGYTINGTSPGPLIEVTQGQLLEVHLHNDNVPDGITLHWHGVDVPNAEDGVAGVTQNAVMPGPRLHLPVRGAGGRHLLVPLPPGLARAGDRRAARAAGGAPAPPRQVACATSSRSPTPTTASPR